MLQEYLQELSKVNILSEDEERTLWQRYKDDNDLQARARLIEAYQPLVFKLVMKMQPKEDLILDLIQEATVGLIEAVERYNYKRGIGFPSYASFRIRGQIINFLQRINFDILSLDQAYATQDDELPTLVEQLSEQDSDEITSIEKISWSKPLKLALSRLPEKEKRIIKAVYLEDKDPQIVARELNISLPHLYRLQKRGLRRVRGMLSRLRHELKLGNKWK
jgi:RNA polymerase sporulation-specific sigma factor